MIHFESGADGVSISKTKLDCIQCLIDLLLNWTTREDFGFPINFLGFIKEWIMA